MVNNVISTLNHHKEAHEQIITKLPIEQAQGVKVLPQNDERKAKGKAQQDLSFRTPAPVKSKVLESRASTSL